MVAPRWDLLLVVAVVVVAVVSALHFTAMPHAVRFAYHSPAKLGVLVSLYSCLSPWSPCSLTLFVCASGWLMNLQLVH